MDTTLAINPGSSSKKYALYQNGVLVFTLRFEKTGDGFGRCLEINGERKKCTDVSKKEYERALEAVLEAAKNERVIKSETDITRVGVRIVAPGTFFAEHRKIDPYFLEKLSGKEDAAPLHIPAIVDEITKVIELVPDALHVGVSDSAFHNTLPPHARAYSIPKADAKEFDVYRFGYHGLSVNSVVRSIKEEHNEVPERMIVCHLGSGASITAVKKGVSIDTTMGFSPASGLMMNTRSGDIDPGALLYLIEQKNLSGDKAHRYINKEGGLKGQLGNGDLRVAFDRVSKREVDAEDAVKMYVYRIQKQIGAMMAVLGGLDTLVFTATAPERNPLVRKLVCQNLEGLGIVLDEEVNEELTAQNGAISKEDSDVVVYVQQTNEMEMLASVAVSFS